MADIKSIYRSTSVLCNGACSRAMDPDKHRPLPIEPDPLFDLCSDDLACWESNGDRHHSPIWRLVAPYFSRKWNLTTVPNVSRQGFRVGVFFMFLMFLGAIAPSSVQDQPDHAPIGAGLEQKQEQGRKIILEHTSANPTDRLHVGRARNPIIGDTLAV